MIVGRVYGTTLYPKNYELIPTPLKSVRIVTNLICVVVAVL
jgi:hypothetical protein